MSNNMLKDSTAVNNNTLVITTAIEKFCPKCGNHYSDESIVMCPYCNQSLNFTESYKVKRVCNKCDFTVIAPPSYFENPVNLKCNNCKVGLLEKEDINNYSASFVIDGKWNGVPVGKKIREKNEQLKKKHAGYEHETPETIRKKTERAAREGKL